MFETPLSQMTNTLPHYYSKYEISSKVNFGVEDPFKFSRMCLKNFSVSVLTFSEKETRKLIKSPFICLLTMESSYELAAE